MLASIEVDAASEGGNHEILRKVVSSIAASRRIVAVTGAGISVSAGIPDFRSADGLYARVLSSPATDASAKGAKGKDFFDASFFHNPSTRPLFNRFVAELRSMCTAGSPTPTHKFLGRLASDGRLQRWYTQNIDGLERVTGLMTSTCSAPADAGSKKAPLVVSLHGTLDRLVCTLCKDLLAYTEEHNAAFLRGASPECAKCAAFSAERQANGRRAVKGGVMRPDIVLYNEPHPQGDLIADFLAQDMSRRPNVLIVMGTSLKVVGLKKMVKDLARAVRQQPGGMVVFVNKTAAPRSEWKTVFDYELLGECDRWVAILEEAGLAPAGSPKTSAIGAESSRRDGRIDKIFKTVRRAVPVAADVKKGHDAANDENRTGREANKSAVIKEKRRDATNAESSVRGEADKPLIKSAVIKEKRRDDTNHGDSIRGETDKPLIKSAVIKAAIPTDNGRGTPSKPRPARIARTTFKSTVS